MAHRVGGQVTVAGRSTHFYKGTYPKYRFLCVCLYQECAVKIFPYSSAQIRCLIMHVHTCFSGDSYTMQSVKFGFLAARGAARGAAGDPRLGIYSPSPFPPFPH